MADLYGGGPSQDPARDYGNVESIVVTTTAEEVYYGGQSEQYHYTASSNYQLRSMAPDETGRVVDLSDVEVATGARRPRPRRQQVHHSYMEGYMVEHVEEGEERLEEEEVIEEQEEEDKPGAIERAPPKKQQRKSRRAQRDEDMHRLEEILRESNDIEDSFVKVEMNKDSEYKRKRAEQARQRYYKMSEEERRIYNHRRRMKALGLDENGHRIVDSELFSNHIKQQNKRKADAARDRYHSMNDDEKRMYNTRRTESFRRRRMEEENLLSTPAGRISQDALQKAQLIMLRNARKAEAARMRYQSMTPEQRRIYNHERRMSSKRARAGTGSSAAMTSPGGGGGSRKVKVERRKDGRMSNTVKDEHHQLHGDPGPSSAMWEEDDDPQGKKLTLLRSSAHREGSLDLDRTMEHVDVEGLEPSSSMEDDHRRAYERVGEHGEELVKESWMQSPSGYGSGVPVDESEYGYDPRHLDVFVGGPMVEREVEVGPHSPHLATLGAPGLDTAGGPPSHLSDLHHHSHHHMHEDDDDLLQPEDDDDEVLRRMQHQHHYGLENERKVIVMTPGSFGDMSLDHSEPTDHPRHPLSIALHELQHKLGVSPRPYTPRLATQGLLAHAEQATGIERVTSQKLAEQRARKALRARIRYANMRPDEKQRFNAKRAEELRMSRRRDEQLVQLADNDLNDVDEHTRKAVEDAQVRRSRRAEQARTKYRRMNEEERRQYNAMRDAQRRLRRRELEAMSAAQAEAASRHVSNHSDDLLPVAQETIVSRGRSLSPTTGGGVVVADALDGGRGDSSDYQFDAMYHPQSESIMRWEH